MTDEHPIVAKTASDSASDTKRFMSHLRVMCETAGLFRLNACLHPVSCRRAESSYRAPWRWGPGNGDPAPSCAARCPAYADRSRRATVKAVLTANAYAHVVN